MRVSLKVTGAQGQGVNSVGEICAKGLKRSGYCVFGYREYMSLIKGGHSSYQLDVSEEHIRSTEMRVDILVCFNHHGLKRNLREVKDGGIILHQTPEWKFSPEDQQWMEQHRVHAVFLPTEKILKDMGAPPILANMLITSVVWSMLRQSSSMLKELAREQFSHKGEKVLALNERCIDEGIRFREEHAPAAAVELPPSESRWKDCMLLTGSQAIGLGTVHAGCRVYAGYPMTPSSPLLTYIAEIQNRTGMAVKQAEDEITAAQMMSGAMFMGARAMTATSGGGFDLMTETLSMNGIVENPCVFALAMRPGPGTGLPTWSAQGDLLMAVHAGHGEFARCVLAVSDSQDAFDLMPTAFNLAEKYQLSVIVLYDKQIAEALYTQPLYDQNTATVERGHVTDPTTLRALTGAHRYNPQADDGVSPRWLPGTPCATYCGQADEHAGNGSDDESAANATAQMEKRMRKMEALARDLPEPTLFSVHGGQWSLQTEDPTFDLLVVGWGSTKGAALDALSRIVAEHPARTIGYLHFTYLWPLKAARFSRLAALAKRIVIAEGNAQGQLHMLLRQASGIEIPTKILKYDGRPFFVDELCELLSPFA